MDYHGNQQMGLFGDAPTRWSLIVGLKVHISSNNWYWGFDFVIKQQSGSCLTSSNSDMHHFTSSFSDALESPISENFIFGLMFLQSTWFQNIRLIRDQMLAKYDTRKATHRNMDLSRKRFWLHKIVTTGLYRWCNVLADTFSNNLVANK
jgi:hypothetical protein